MAPQNPPSPLNDTHCDCLSGVCKSCSDTLKMIEQAEAAGYDMTQARAINQQQLDTAMRTKAAYFPNQP